MIPTKPFLFFCFLVGGGYTVQCSVSILVTRDRETLNQGQRQYKRKIEAMVVAVEVNEG